MALGVPVVATRVGGVASVIEDRVNGRLIEPGRIDALAASISELLGDPALRQQLGEAGRCTVERRYSFAKRMQRLAGIYDDMLIGARSVSKG
jgi:glycosyltransferase involved in cell wall biosynthesis